MNSGHNKGQNNWSRAKIMVIRWKQFGCLGFRHVTSFDWMEHIIRVVIPYICMYHTHIFQSTIILPRHQSTQKLIFWSNNMLLCHRSTSHHQLIPHYQSNKILPPYWLMPSHPINATLARPNQDSRITALFTYTKLFTYTIFTFYVFSQGFQLFWTQKCYPFYCPTSC